MNRRWRFDHRACRKSRKTRFESGASSINLARRNHRTQQYSITSLTDWSGAIKERYAYDAYGGLSIFDASGTARTTTAEGNRYTYTGREWDEELELYHFRYRMYDFASGRFLGRDPIGYQDEAWNLSSFVFNSPVSNIDPLGLESAAPYVMTSMLDWYKKDSVRIGVGIHFSMTVDTTLAPCECDGFSIVQWVTDSTRTYETVW